MPVPAWLRPLLAALALVTVTVSVTLSIDDSGHPTATTHVKIIRQAAPPKAELPEYEPQPAPQAVGALAGVVGGKPVAAPVIAGARPVVRAASVPSVQPVRVDRALRIKQFQHVIRELKSRIAAHKAAGHDAPRLKKALKRRRALLRRIQARALELPPAKAVAWARLQLGTTESPANSNRGPKIDQWELAHGMIGQPWCGAFVGMALRAGGVTLPNGIVYTPTILAWAKAGTYGLQLVRGPPAPGDLVLYDFFAGGPPVMHVGLYEGKGFTIEGNTSSGTAGSQDNGGGVFRRFRGGQYVVAYVRPPWPKA